MKKGIFNAYVKLICDGIGISREELLSKSRNRELAQARYILYYLCHQRPITIKKIIKLLDEEEFSVGYESVRGGIRTISNGLENGKDKDLNNFINDCIKTTVECC